MTGGFWISRYILDLPHDSSGLNEGLVWDPLQKNVLILLVTGIPGFFGSYHCPFPSPTGAKTPKDTVGVEQQWPCKKQTKKWNKGEGVGYH